MGMRICLCCEKWWDVALGKNPQIYRKRCKDGLVHDFQRYIPPRKRWETVTQFCILCMEVHIFYIGPVTGKYHSNLC